MNVIHQPEQHRFVIPLNEGEAVLEYQLLPEQGINFSRTYVPFSSRGQGLAEDLVKAGLDWANAQAFRMQATCWYVQPFLSVKGEPNGDEL